MIRPNRRLARFLALLSVGAAVGSLLALSTGLVLATAAVDNEHTVPVLVAALVLVAASYLLRAWGRWLVGLPPFRETHQ